MSDYTVAWYEKNWVALAVGIADQGSANSNWYDMSDFHRATVVLMTGTVGAGEDVRASVYTASDGQGTGRVLVKEMTTAQAVNGNDDLAIIEMRTEEMQTALSGARYIRVECTATGTPIYGALLIRHSSRREPVDVTHVDRLIS